jgi:hypothetical protein
MIRYNEKDPKRRFGVLVVCLPWQTHQCLLCVWFADHTFKQDVYLAVAILKKAWSSRQAAREWAAQELKILRPWQLPQTLMRYGVGPMLPQPEFTLIEINSTLVVRELHDTAYVMGVEKWNGCNQSVWPSITYVNQDANTHTNHIFLDGPRMVCIEWKNYITFVGYRNDRLTICEIEVVDILRCQKGERSPRVPTHYYAHIEI